MASQLFIRIFDRVYAIKGVSDDERISGLSFDSLMEFEARVFASLVRATKAVMVGTNAQRGSAHISRLVEIETLILKSADPEYSKHLMDVMEQGKIELAAVMVRWNTYHFARELNNVALALLWDKYSLEEDYAGFITLHPYVCVELIQTFRKQLMATEDFESMFKLLMNLPISQWGEDEIIDLVERARTLREAHPNFVAEFKDRLHVNY